MYSLPVREPSVLELNSGPACYGSGRAVLGLALSLALLVVAGCATQQQGAGPGVAPLRVGVTANCAPFIFKNGRDVVGLEAQFARDLGAALGRPVRFVHLRRRDQIPALAAGKADIIMSGLSATRERAALIAFTGPYLRTGQMALVRAPDLAKYFVPRDPSATPFRVLTSRGRIGVEVATSGERFVRGSCPRAKQVTYASSQRGAEALAAGKIDILVHDAPVVWWLATQNREAGLVPVPVYLTEELLTWGVRKDDTELLSACNAFLSDYRRNGDLDRVIKYWLPRTR